MGTPGPGGPRVAPAVIGSKAGVDSFVASSIVMNCAGAKKPVTGVAATPAPPTVAFVSVNVAAWSRTSDPDRSIRWASGAVFWRTVSVPSGWTAAGLPGGPLRMTTTEAPGGGPNDQLSVSANASRRFCQKVSRSTVAGGVGGADGP